MYLVADIGAEDAYNQMPKNIQTEIGFENTCKISSFCASPLRRVLICYDEVKPWGRVGV